MTYRTNLFISDPRPARIVLSEEPVKIRLCRRCLSAHTSQLACKLAA